MKLSMMYCKLFILKRKLKNGQELKKEALINGDFEMLQLLAECRNATHFKYFGK